MHRDRLEAFAATLSSTDVVVVEATGNAAAVAAVIRPHVKRMVIANPMQVRVIAYAKIKTDTIDAGVLAQLYASGFLPEVWIADEATQALRRQVTRRNQVVRQRSRIEPDNLSSFDRSGPLIQTLRIYSRCAAGKCLDTGEEL